jgi:hypothetical protein
VPSLARKFRSYSHEALSVSWTRVTVLSVAETSPAAAGGIKPGDHLLTFNNEAVPSSETADWISRFVRNNGERPIRVLVRHDGVDEMRTVTPVIACAIPIGLITDSSLNAFTPATGSLSTQASCGSLVPMRSLPLFSSMSLPTPISVIWTSIGQSNSRMGRWRCNRCQSGAWWSMDRRRICSTVRSCRRIGIQREFRAGGRLCRRLLCNAGRLRSHRSRRNLEGVLVGEPRRYPDRANAPRNACAFRADAEGCRRDCRQNSAATLYWSPSSRLFRPKRTRLTIPSNDWDSA